MTEANAGAVLQKLVPLSIPRLAQGTIARALGLQQAQEVYQDIAAQDDARPLTDRLLDRLEVSYRLSDRDLERIPRSGPAIVVVNHPFGILDGAVVASLLLRVRPDVRLVANEILTVIPEVRDLLIAVDPVAEAGSTRTNGRGVRKALEFLAGGGLLAVFPAGEVAHFTWTRRAIADPEWSAGIARLISIADRRSQGLSIVPAHVSGSNSTLFQVLGTLHPRFRTALLVRELLNKRRLEVEVRIGQPIPAGKLLAIPSDQERTEYLRWRTDLLAHRNQFKPRTALPLPHRRVRATAAPIVAPMSAERMAREVAALEPQLQSGDLQVYLAPAERIPVVLAEIGRLREVAFRAAGEGTGKPSDLDAYDAHYLHLFVWNAGTNEVVAAYRLGPADSIRHQLGVRGLYTATLFEYGPEFLDRLGPALELGRSFVRVEYQKAFAPLLLLWKGIGRYIAAHPHYKVLFGPVSISNQYQSISRQLMVSFLERRASLAEWAALVSSRNPFRPRASRPPGASGAALNIDDLSTAVSEIEPAQPGIPVLLRQYLKLGGKLLGFNVDPAFADALDGLILVDLTKTEPKLLERYLGKAEAASFLGFHRRTI